MKFARNELQKIQRKWSCYSRTLIIIHEKGTERMKRKNYRKLIETIISDYSLKNLSKELQIQVAFEEEGLERMTILTPERERYYFLADFTPSQLIDLQRLASQEMDAGEFVNRYPGIQTPKEEIARYKEIKQTMHKEEAIDTIIEAIKKDPTLSVVGQVGGALSAEAKVHSAYANSDENSLRINGDKRSLRSLQKDLKERNVHTDMGEGKGFYRNQFHLDVSLPAATLDKKQEQLPAAEYITSQQTQGYSR